MTKINVDPIKIYKLKVDEGKSIKDLCSLFGVSRGCIQTYIKKGANCLGLDIVKRTTKGQKRTEDQKNNMRKPKSDSARSNMSKVRIGYKPSEKSITNWKSTMALTEYAHLKTEEYRMNHSLIMKDRKKSEGHIQKMRDFMKGRPYNNYKRGFFNSDKNGKKIFYRSSLELKAYIIFENDNEVTHFVAEPFDINYVFNKTIRPYTPDIKVVYNNGSIKIVEVKREDELDWPINIAKFDFAKKYCLLNNWTFDVLTDKYLDSIIVKRDELLGTLHKYVDNQQPTSLNRSKNVDEKVQRLTGEEDLANKPDTSVPHVMLSDNMMI